MSTTAPHVPRWSHAPLEESFDGARMLTVSVADRVMRGSWEQLAWAARIPPRRWRRHHPFRDGPLVTLIDGAPALDLAAWSRFASLVPGSVATPTRTAASLDVAPGELDPPGRWNFRLVDLIRARRARARLRRAERTLGADHAVFRAQLQHHLEQSLVSNDAGVPLEELPEYALAARIEQLLAACHDWRTPAVIEYASRDATARLLRALIERGDRPGAALLETAQLQCGGGGSLPGWLEDLRAITLLPTTHRSAALGALLDTRAGWHAMRALLLEATPLREHPDAALRWLESPNHPHTNTAPAPRIEDDLRLEALAARARRLSTLREQVAHDRAELHAALRALTWTLARRLTDAGTIDRADDVFDLSLETLLTIARGGALPTRHAREPDTNESGAAPDVPTPSDAPLRGIPASTGSVTGPVVVLDDPKLDAPVEGAILVCRVVDPGWLPLVLHCGAIVTERGGPMSHAAIVARELGLPAVVGVPGAVDRARTSRRATVDGATGAVTFDASS